MWLCLAPVILTGYAFLFGQGLDRYPLEPHTQQLEIQSCQRGIGGYVNATHSGLYAGGIQWGFQHTIDNITVSLVPHFGVSHTDHEVWALPSYTQFDTGLGLYGEYNQVVIGMKVSHWSNGNAIFNWADSAGRQNVGINMAVLQLGWRF